MNTTVWSQLSSLLFEITIPFFVPSLQSKTRRFCLISRQKQPLSNKEEHQIPMNSIKNFILDLNYKKTCIRTWKNLPKYIISLPHIKNSILSFPSQILHKPKEICK